MLPLFSLQISKERIGLGGFEPPTPCTPSTFPVVTSFHHLLPVMNYPVFYAVLSTWLIMGSYGQ
jgi:hypothetical protein